MDERLFLEQAVIYIPEEWRYALAAGQPLPKRAEGAALFADISGFTPLSEKLAEVYGLREGAERLPVYLSQIYDVLIAEVTRYGGSVIDFAGDSITCWFDNNPGPARWPGGIATGSARACTAALKMQAAIARMPGLDIAGAGDLHIGVKIAVAAGSVRRFLVGDPSIQRFALLAGDTLRRMADGEHLAKPGEIWIDHAAATALSGQAEFLRTELSEAGDRFHCLQSLSTPALECPWPELALDQLTVEQAGSWLLPPVRQKLGENLGVFLTELRPAVPLFLRFSGLDFDNDAQVGKRLDEFIKKVQQIVQGHEGVLLQITIGDKGSYLYAVFGVPLAHEDDPRRAVSAALELRKLCDSLEFLEEIQVGISQGTLRAGTYGSKTRRTYGALGDETNLAARLMSRAAAGEILVNNRVFQSVTAERAQRADIYLFDPRPPMKMKGKVEPLPVFMVTGAKRRTSVRVLEPVYALPMVGRQAELADIEEKLRLALAGQGQVTAICADAGMGKSRLSAEIVRKASQIGMDCYGGACQSDSTNTPYFVWSAIWRAFFDFNPEAPLKRQIRSVTAIVEDYAPERGDSIPLLGPLLGIEIPENEFTAELEPQYQRMALEALLVDCLKGAARDSAAAKGGLLIVLEDLHWVDPASLDLLERAVRACAALPVLFLLAYRPPDIHEAHEQRVARLPNFNRVSLPELSGLEAEQAVRAKFAQLYPEWRGEMPYPLIRRVGEVSQGNPFYAEELLNYLNDQNIDFHDPQAVESLDLPTSLQSLILSRVDRLTSQQQAALKSAAVVGRIFQEQVVNGMLERERVEVALEKTLNELQRRELILHHNSRGSTSAGISPSANPSADGLFGLPGLEYIFKHIITLEVTYHSLLNTQRRLLHRLAAESIEGLFPNDLENLSAILAYHYELGDAPEKAFWYLKMAAVRAQFLYANEEAINFYRKAINQAQELQKANPGPSASHELAGLYESIGKMLYITGQTNEAVSALQAAIELTAREDWQSQLRLFRQIAYIQNIHAEYAASEEAIQRVYDVLRVEQDTLEWRSEWIEAKLLETNLCYWRNEIEKMTRLVNEMDPFIHKHGTVMQRSKHEANRSSRVMRTSRFLMTTEDLIYINDSYILARETSDSHWLAEIVFRRGMAFLFANQIEEAASIMEESLESSRKMGDALLELRCRIYLSVAWRRLGNVHAVEEQIPLCFEASQLLDMKDYSDMTYGNQAWVFWKQGDLKKAWSVTEMARENAVEQSPMRWVVLLPEMAIALARGDLALAIQSSRELLAPHQKQFEAPLVQALENAIAYWEAGQAEETQAALAEAQRLAEELRYL